MLDPQSQVHTPSDLAVLKQVRRRIVWLLFALFLFQALDRANVSYAALEMNRALGFSPKQFGFGVSVTFVGLLLFQIPSILLLKRIGARAWFTLIVALWGVATIGLAFIASHSTFYFFRFMIGVFEAGFSPGLVWFLSQWLPDRERGGAMGLVLMAIPVSQIVGAPLSGLLLSYGDQFGAEGWRLLFLFEGFVTILLAILAFIKLSDRPETATWLSTDERGCLARLIKASEPIQDTTDSRGQSLGAVLRARETWMAAVLWCCLSMGMYGLVFWLPQLVKQIAGGTTLTASLLSGLPWVAAAIGMVVNGHGSDRSGRRSSAIFGACAVGAFGLGLAASTTNPIFGLLGLIIAGLGVSSTHSVFWTIPPRLFARNQLQSGILAINLCGTVSGFLVSNMIGWIQQETGSLRMALVFLSGVVILGGGLAIMLRRKVDTATNADP